MTLLKDRDVAERIGLSTATLANWRHRKIGPRFFKIGGKAVRYDAADIEAFCRQRPTPTRDQRTDD